MLTAIIFDFDGVISDSEKLHHDSLKAVIYSHNLEFDEDFFKDTLGLSLQEIFQKCRSTANLHTSVQKLVEQYEEYFITHLNTELNIVDGADEIVNFVISQGYKTAIASSAKKNYIIKALQKFNLYNQYKEHIVSIEMVENGKPAPDLFLKASELLHEKPENCLVLENTLDGIVSAQRAGMQTLYLTHATDNHTASNLKCITSLREIDLALLTSLNSD